MPTSAFFKKLNDHFEFHCEDCEEPMRLRRARGKANPVEWICTDTSCKKVIEVDDEELTKYHELLANAPAPNKGVKAGVVGTSKVLKDAAIAAGSAVIAAKVAEGMVQLARHHAGEHWPAALDTPAGKKLAQAAIPVAVLFLCQAFGTTIPAAGKAERAATLAIHAMVASSATETLAHLVPFLQNLAQLAEGVPLRKLLHP